MAKGAGRRKYGQLLTGRLKGATREEQRHASDFMIDKWCKEDNTIAELAAAVPETLDYEAGEGEGEGEEEDELDEPWADDIDDDQCQGGPAFPASTGNLHVLPKPLSEVNVPVVSVAQHHHIIQFVDVDPAYCPPRRFGNLLSNSCSDSSHHYHTSSHEHHLKFCELHMRLSEKDSVYWQPHVRMHSFTVGTVSEYTIFEKLHYVQMSHHFIHVHDIYCKDLCLNPQGEPHGCSRHPQAVDHGCLLFHIKTRPLDNEGFSRAAVRVETSSWTTTQCSRYGTTDFAQFQHSHAHEHSLYMTLTKGNPSEDPHDPYYDFLLPRDPLQGLPCSPFST
ncbi:hypothetical protein L7F22_004332 [Adiantum nelumboides]|nr:hypothetical protein [Adiantum nelumboides]